ncbi:hypothetical protein DDI_0182 [Dickeya dianthicola RNS04.9]|nr:hypothetical protein DDI_0182 [Dickeya dianthicola RNS04.9]
MNRFMAATRLFRPCFHFTTEFCHALISTSALRRMAAMQSRCSA